jgi:hypothetical protein
MESELDTLVLKKRRARLLNPQTAPESFLVSTMFQYMPPQPIPQYNPPQPQQPMEEDYDRRRESLASEVSDIKIDLLRAMDAQHLHENKHSERIEAAATRGESARAASVAKARGENVEHEPQPEEQPQTEERYNQKAHDARVERDTSRRISARSSSVMRSRTSATHGQTDRAFPTDTPAIPQRTRTRAETKMSGLTDAEKSEMLRELLSKGTDVGSNSSAEHRLNRVDAFERRAHGTRATSVTRTRGM